MPRSEKRTSGLSSSLGITMWRLWKKNTRLCFLKTTRPDAFIAEMAPQRIRRHDGDPKDQSHLHPTNTDSRLLSWRHLCLQCHPRQLETIRELNIPKSSICRPDMCIHIHIFPVMKFSLLMHLPRIASKIPILIQICWLMKEHPLVSTLSAVW